MKKAKREVVFLTSKEEVLDAYLRAYKKHKKVDVDKLREQGINRHQMRQHFKNMNNFHKEVREYFPEKFNNVMLKEALSFQNIKSILTQISGYKRFVITTAIIGSKVNKGFLDSIHGFCKTQNAKLLILLATDKSSDGDWCVDKELSGELIITNDINLNNNLIVSSLKLSAKHIDPLTGLERIGQRKNSFIYASPKQRLRVIPTSNEKLPHILCTTGAITEPNYKSNGYCGEKSMAIATDDHLTSALIVEIENSEIFHIRQIQADKDGSFIDLGIKYHLNKKIEENAEAIIFGDIHSGELDINVVNCYKQICKTLRPKYGIMHGLFNGLSINYHEMNNQILRAQRAEQGTLSLEKELIQVGADLEIFQKMVQKIVVVKSNHDEFLSRYLKEGLYVEDPQNHRLCLKIALKMLEGKDSLEEAISLVYTKKLKDIKWLKRNDEFKLAGVQLAIHGDKGSNGTKGSIKSMESSYGNCITAHSHTPQILRSAYVVGTSSYLKLEYNQDGASSWMQGCCILYKNGSRQLLHIIDSKWKL